MRHGGLPSPVDNENNLIQNLYSTILDWVNVVVLPQPRFKYSLRKYNNSKTFILRI